METHKQRGAESNRLHHRPDLGQLESELAENSWLTVEARPDIIFDVPIERRYDEALGLLGLQARMISPEAGHS